MEYKQEEILKTVQNYKKFLKTKYDNIFVIKSDNKYITDKFNIYIRADAFMNFISLDKTFSGSELLAYGQLFSRYRVCLMTITNYLFGANNSHYDYIELTKYWNIANKLNLSNVFNLDYLISETFIKDFSQYLKSLNIEFINTYYEKDFPLSNYPYVTEDMPMFYEVKYNHN